MANLFDSIISGFMNNYSNPPQNPQQTESLPHSQVVNDYRNAVQNAPGNEVQQAQQSYYQQIPQDQRENIFNAMVSALQQHGVNLSDLGIQNPEPTPQNLAAINKYVDQKPDLFQSIFGPGGKLSSPLAKMAMAGALAVLASKFSKKG